MEHLDQSLLAAVARGSASTAVPPTYAAWVRGGGALLGAVVAWVWLSWVALASFLPAVVTFLVVIANVQKGFPKLSRLKPFETRQTGMRYE